MSVVIKISVLLTLIFFTGILLGLKHSGVPAPQSDVNTQEIRRLTTELAALQKQYAEVASSTKPPSHDLHKPALSDSSLQDESIAAFESKVRADAIARVERIKEIYRKNPQFDSSEAKRNMFESEPVDKTWAESREEAISQAFKNMGSLQGKVLKSIECRSKWCRIEIYFQDTSETVFVAQDVYDLTRHEKYGQLFAMGGDMGVSLNDKVISIYLSSDPSVSFF